MSTEKTAANQAASPTQEIATPEGAAVADMAPALAIGDTLTVVSGRLGGAWVVEDENGVVYMATPVE